MLFLPRMIVADEQEKETSAKFVKAGGTLVCESECGAFNPEGVYRYPEDRFTACLSGVGEVGRRNINIDSVKATADDIISSRKTLIQNTEAGQECRFKAAEWRFSVLVEN